jgi:hypothetical protein
MNLTEANRVWEAPIIPNWTVPFRQEHYKHNGEILEISAHQKPTAE